jgi:hypothetical protein
MGKTERIGLAFPEHIQVFSVADLLDSQDGTAVPIDANGNALTLLRDGWITGLTVALSAPLTGGAVTVKPAINGTEDADAAVVLDATNPQFNYEDFAPKGMTPFNAGDRLSCVYDSNADVEPNTGDLIAAVHFCYDDEM